MGLLFVNVWLNKGEYFVNVTTFITVYLFRLSESTNLALKINLLDKKPKDALINLNISNLDYEIVSELVGLADLCTWPAILLDKYVISGLCSVARQICKGSPKENVKSLLGFREACLVACAESSVWTRFCEIDIIETIEKLLVNDFFQQSNFVVPEDILKYENHLSKPVRVHNIYKIARENHNDRGLTSSTPREDLEVLHEYAEGPYMTLADIILYSCFQVFFDYCSNVLLHTKIPLIVRWFDRLKTLDLPAMNFCVGVNIINFSSIITCEVNNVSLYNADPTRVVSENHTRQYKIDNALKLIEKILGDVTNSTLPYGFNRKFDWDMIPIEANPQGGSLPKKRAGRKCEQLENLAKAVLEVVGEKSYRIIDFCSGSGHLGLLVATLLPHCQIILVENKERSLARARESIANLKLNNVIVVQSNLDYFVGKFDLGMALHACGVATDLVLQMCIKNKADFVCCPCCYGGIKDCHQLTFPRSKKYKELFDTFENSYFDLAHAADQTHEEQNAKTKQGYFCMDIIDSDRKLYAEGCGYKVHLGKLQPVTCTNKNNLLVGIFYRREIFV